eukprot:3865819-Pleurochrysis_carterae.AAC.1
MSRWSALRAQTHDRTMAPASCERAGEKFNPPTIPLRGNCHRWRHGHQSGARLGRHGAPCRGWG